MDDRVLNLLQRGPYFQDMRDTWPQWVVAVALAMTHTGITLWLPVKGCPTGYTGPGGLSDKSKHTHCTGGAAAYIDSLFFHHSHLLSPHALEDAKPPVYKMHHPFDPQGNCNNYLLLGILKNRKKCLYDFQFYFLTLYYS